MLAPDIRKEYRYVNWALSCVLFALVVAPLAVNIPGASVLGVPGFHLPACPVLQHTGRPCAACGLTRSVLALYRGDFALSAKWHPAGSLLVALILLQLLLRILYQVGKSAWLPWIDIGQILLTGLLFKYVLIGTVPVWNHALLPFSALPQAQRGRRLWRGISPLRTLRCV